MSRRDTLVETIKEEKLRLEKNPEKQEVRSIELHIKFLQSEIKKIESEIRARNKSRTNHRSIAVGKKNR